MRVPQYSLTASVTLYLSVSFTLLLSIICYTIESCHLDAVVCHAEGISYISSDSLFANYCLPLFEDYGIFAINEQGIDTKNLLLSYVERNCEIPSGLFTSNNSLIDLSVSDVDITDYHYLTDNDGKVFVEQICEYVKFLQLDVATDWLLDASSTDIPDIFVQTEAGLPNITFDSVNPTELDTFTPNHISKTGETDEDLTNIDCKTFSSDISASISHLIKNGLLSCIVADPATVSSSSIDKIVMPSVTCELTEEGFNASNGYYKDTSKATYEKACFCEYIINTFGSYTSDVTDSPLKYQLEYIISGSPDDDTNLINTALQLITLRTGLNLIHLLSDSDKYNAAWNIASNASSIPGVPYVIQGIILTVWSTAEAIIDVRDLLSGKSVPLLKDKEHWSLSVNGLGNFSKNTPSSNKGDEGISYERYLEMLMALQNNISIYYRTLDLIQMELCHQYNSNFRISQCVTGIEADITYILPMLITAKKYSYTSNVKFDYK